MTPMPRSCIVCAKRTQRGFAVSHSHIRTKRRLLPNLQKVRIQVGESPERHYVCTKCLKAGKVVRAL